MKYSEKDFNKDLDELVQEFLDKAKERGIPTEFLCDPQRLKYENKLRETFKNLLSASFESRD